MLFNNNIKLSANNATKIFLNFFVCIFIFISIVTLVQAQTTHVSYRDILDDKVGENQVVDLSFIVDSPPINCTIYIETDLRQNGNSPIYDFGELNNNFFQEIDKSKNRIMLTTYPNDFEVTIHGVTPIAKKTLKSDYLKFYDFIEGPYDYYEIRVISYDNHELGIEGSPSYSFNVESIELKNLNDKMSEIRSDGDRLFAQDLYNKKLINELEDFIELEQNEEDNSSINNYLMIAIGLVVFLIGFILAKYIYKPSPDLEDE